MFVFLSVVSELLHLNTNICICKCTFVVIYSMLVECELLQGMKGTL